MIDKIGIYACPEKDCLAVSLKSGKSCPRHTGVVLIQYTYIRHESSSSKSFDFGSGDMSDILGNLFNRQASRK